jgi:hypothetical protein
MTTTLMVLCGTLTYGDVAFLRGDANSDGVVSTSDAHFVFSNLFRGLANSECLDAADFNDKDGIDIKDGVDIMNYLIVGDFEPPLPFPAVGADPTLDELDCRSYGGGTTLIDPAAVLQVSDAVSEGGKVRLVISIANSKEISGYFGRIVTPRDTIQSVNGAPRNLAGEEDAGFKLAALQAETIHFAFWPSIMEMDFMPPGGIRQGLELTIELNQGVMPGTYPLTIESGEMTDARSGRVITPQLVSAFLTVLERADTVFVRGDSSRDNMLDVSDPVRTLGYLFLGSSRLACDDAADADDNGLLNIADAIFTLEFLFQGGLPPPPPHSTEGLDPTVDGLDCLSQG